MLLKFHSEKNPSAGGIVVHRSIYESKQKSARTKIAPDFEI